MALVQPGEIIAPQITDAQVRQIVAKVYGLSVTTMKAFPGYDDKNFYIEVEGNCINKNIKNVSLDGYIFKIINTRDSKNYSLFETQTTVMQRLLESGLPCPRPVADINDQYFSIEKIYDNGVLTEDASENDSFKGHLVRLLTFIPGTVLDKSEGINLQFLYDLGVTAAKMDAVLETITPKGLHTSMWHMINLPSLRDFIYMLDNCPQRQNLVSDIISEFESEVLPKLKHLRKTLIHGDYNEQNILVGMYPDAEGNRTNYLAGILDFGDMHAAYRVFEIGLMMMYFGVTVATSHLDFLDCEASAFSGYVSHTPLSDYEIEMLPTIIAARYALSLTMGQYAFSMDPTNTYVLVTARRGWEQLEKLRSYSRQQLIETWKERSYKISNQYT